jgi:outer membrane protein assembly factor BamB
MPQLFGACPRLACLAVLAALAGPAAAPGQAPAEKTATGRFALPAAMPRLDSVPFATDPTLGTTLEQAQQQIQKQAWPEALRLLQKVLDAPADVFLPRPGKDAAGRPVVHGVSARAEAERRLVALPPEALRLYDQLYGPHAQVHLAGAILTSGPPGVARVAQRYRHTRSGQTALALLQRQAHGQAPPRGSIAILSQRRSGDGDLPFLEPTWQRTTFPDERESRKWLEAALAERPDDPLPAAVPLVAGGRLVFRTYTGVGAVDLATGELAWESTSFGSLSRLVDLDLGRRSRARGWFEAHGADGAYVLAANAALGTLSSDGVRVYAVDDLAIPPPPAGSAPHLGGDQAGYGALESFVHHSRLTAIDLDSGKIVWLLGDRSDASALKDCYFLGPPLPVSGRLYVLTERGSELRLACLDPAGGGVCWSRPVGTVGAGLLQDPARRLQAVVLAHADGVLVCPTPAGVILGIDPVLQAPLWAYAYREPGASPGPAAARPGRSRSGYVAPGVPLRRPTWQFSGPVVLDGKVLFTAPDATAVQCVSLRDGAPLWQAPRQDDLYLAGVAEGKVVLVGESSCRALSLDSGRQLWRVETGPTAGLGVVGGGRCFVPLRAGGRPRGAGVCVVDLDKGTVVAHSPARPGDPVGNLLFHGRSLLTQTAKAVAAYPLLRDELESVEAAVQKAPADAAARFKRGRARVAGGDLVGAAEDLTAALAGGPSAEDRPRLRQVLYDVLTRLLHENFSEGEKYLETYRDLCQVPVPAGASPQESTRLGDEQQRRQVLLRQLLAEGCDRQGRLAEAFQAYLDYNALAGAGGLVSDLGEVGLEMRPELWVRRHLAALLRRAAPEQRRTLEEELRSRWRALQLRGTADLLRLVTLLPPDTGLGGELRLELAERLAREGEAAHAQLCLLSLRSQPDAGLAGRAAALLDRIAGTPAYSDEQPPTPDGWLRVAELPGEGPRRTLSPLRPPGDLPPSLRHCRLVLLQAPPRNDFHLALLDADTGAERWQVPLPQPTVNFRGVSVPAAVGRLVGPVLVQQFGGKLYAFDLLGHRMLWEMNRPGNLVLASPSVVCVRTPATLEALDTWTGQTCWTRADVSADWRVVGGAEHLYLVEMSAQGRAASTRALDLADGRAVSVPDFASRYSAPVRSLGRSLLLTPSGPRGERTLLRYDIETGKDPWQHTFPAGSLSLECRNPSQAGMLEPDGTLHLFEVDSGKEILHAYLGGRLPAKALAAHLHQDRSRFYLILNEVPEAAQCNFSNLDSTVVNGTVWAFNRDGRLRWHTAEPIRGEVLLLERFEELPALIFSTRIAKPQNPAQGGAGADIFTRCLDKATGKVVYNRTTTVAGTAGQFFELRRDRAAGTWDVLSDLRVLRHNFAGDGGDRATGAAPGDQPPGRAP